MTHFLSLPLELRQEIYRYLLDANSLAPLESGKSKRSYGDGGKADHSPQYATSLFTVNKQISNESLQFFYARNGFSIVKFASSGSSHKAAIMVDIRRVSLSLLVPEGLRLPSDGRLLLEARVIYTPDVTGHVTLITPSCTLKTLIMIINRDNDGFAGYFSLTYDFTFSSEIWSGITDWRNVNRVSRNILNALMLLRRPSGNFRRYRTIAADCDEEYFHELCSKTFVFYSIEETLSFCLEEQKDADTLVERGLYNAALLKLQSIALLTAYEGIERSHFADCRQLLNTRNLHVDTELKRSGWLATLGHQNSARTRIEKAFKSLLEYTERVRGFGVSDERSHPGLYLICSTAFEEAIASVRGVLSGPLALRGRLSGETSLTRINLLEMEIVRVRQDFKDTYPEIAAQMSKAADNLEETEN